MNLIVSIRECYIVWLGNDVKELFIIYAMDHLSERQGYSYADPHPRKMDPCPHKMDPLTASLHNCAHHFIPHVKDNQCAASILYNGSYYTIVIGKQPVQVSYTPPAVAAMVSSLQASQEKSILGKRPNENENSEPVSYRRMGYDLNDNTLYPSLGHDFK